MLDTKAFELFEAEAMEAVDRFAWIEARNNYDLGFAKRRGSRQTSTGKVYIDPDTKKAAFGEDLEDIASEARLRLYTPNESGLCLIHCLFAHESGDQFRFGVIKRIVKDTIAEFMRASIRHKGNSGSSHNKRSGSGVTSHYYDLESPRKPASMVYTDIPAAEACFTLEWKAEAGKAAAAWKPDHYSFAKRIKRLSWKRIEASSPRSGGFAFNVKRLSDLRGPAALHDTDLPAEAEAVEARESRSGSRSWKFEAESFGLRSGGEVWIGEAALKKSEARKEKLLTSAIQWIAGSYQKRIDLHAAFDFKLQWEQYAASLSDKRLAALLRTIQKRIDGKPLSSTERSRLERHYKRIAEFK